MSTWPRPRRYSVHEYYRMAEVGLLSPGDRTELIEGEIIDMAPIGPEHAHVVSLLQDLLVRSVERPVAVRIQMPVRFMPRSEPQPDVALVRRRGDVYRHTHPGAKDVLLLIEVSDSTLQYDLGVKARLYARQGVPEYWVVDLKNRRVVRHRAPEGREYTTIDQLTEGTLPLPGLVAELSLAELF